MCLSAHKQKLYLTSRYLTTYSLYLFFTFAYLLSFYLKGRKGKTERSPIHWFSPQKLLTAKAESSPSHSPEVNPSLPHWVAGTQVPKPFLVASQGLHQQAAGIRSGAGPQTQALSKWERGRPKQHVHHCTKHPPTTYSLQRNVQVTHHLQKISYFIIDTIIQAKSYVYKELNVPNFI